MKKLFLLCALLAALALPGFAQSPPPLTIKETDGAPSQTNATQLIFNCSGCLTKSGSRITFTPSASSGDVVGPASSTDNAIARYDGTTGKLLQDSAVFVSDGGLIQFAGTSSSFPALKRSGGILQVRAADDSGYASIQANNFTAITDLQLNNATSKLSGGSAGSFDVALIRAAASIWRVSDNSTGAGGLLIGSSSATGAAGSLVVSTNGALSQPSVTINGTPVTGGTATTTKPLTLIETSGATSANWSTNGTMLGINAPSGFTGNLLDIQVNGGTTRLSVDSGQVIATRIRVAAAGVDITSNNGVGIGSTQRFSWSSNTDGSAADTGLQRGAPAVVRFSNGSTGAGTFSSVATSPAQITANQNNYNPGGLGHLQRWNSDASRNVTGMTFTTAQVDGQEHVICNVGAQDIVLTNEDAASTAANRFLNMSGANITLSANNCAFSIYDNTTARWRTSKLP